MELSLDVLQIIDGQTESRGAGAGRWYRDTDMVVTGSAAGEDQMLKFKIRITAVSEANYWNMISEMQEMQLSSTVSMRDSADDTECGSGKCIQGTRPPRKEEEKMGESRLSSQKQPQE
ncbi:hypothetical protein F1880_002976 [Penicillium rolfsii]|nr:hypothetical protein F1880_002976 [Penicillium rolfsii]